MKPKSILKSILLAGALLSVSACSTPPTAQESALLVGAETLANIAGTAAATYYGGAAAGQLASAGLSALGTVLQGYVGTTVPESIVQASPGVANVGEAVGAVIAPNKPVSQKDVNIINAAAQIAETLPAAAVTGTGTGS